MNQGHSGIYRFQPIREFNGEPHFGGVDNGSAENLTPFSQYKIPLKGFVGFLAGTNYKTITKQNKPAGVTYSDKDFGVVGPGQTAQINADQSSFFSTGVIKGVKPGKYILRLASNLCTQGDGSAYDINGIEYQNTSTFVYSANGGVGTREILLDLPDIPNGTKTTIDAGTFVVEDKINGSDLNYHGYVVDTDGIFDREDLELAYTMEGQVVTTRTLGAAHSESVTSDHNGFFYGSLPSGDGVLQFQVAKTPTATGSNIYDFSDGVTTSNYFIGNYDDLRNATEVVTGSPNPVAYDYRLVAMTDLQYNLFANYQLGVFLVNKNDDYDAYHFDIAELIQYGNPVKALPGMTFALEGTGRTAKSGKDGQAIIRTYSPNTSTQRSGLNVMIGNDTLYCVVDTNPYPETVTIQYGPLAANSINQYIVTLINTPQKYWKHGDTISFGIVYYDEWGRSGAVNTNESLNVKIPFFGENDDANLGQTLSWEIHHQPPVWAHYYQWVRTRGVLSNYIQMAVDGAKYVKSYTPDTDDYSYVAYGGGATEVHLDLQTITNTAKVSPSWRVGYSFVEGDRVRIVRLGNGDYPDEYFHAKVLGQIGDSLSIEYDPSWPEVTEGMVVELYSPAPSTDNDTSIFYEFSDRYEIIDPGTSIRNHLAGSQNQIYSLEIPALGEFDTGNTFIKQRKFLINEGQNQVFVEVEDTAFSDFFPSNVQSIGRPNVVDETFRQIIKPNSSRFSNKFYSDTASGTSSFEPLNEKNFPNSVGGINEMVFNENVLVCIGKMKTFSIYVGESQITSGSDQLLVSLSNEVLGAWRMMKGDYGTVNPRSVAMSNGDIYWYDMTRGAVVRYAADGLTRISDNGMRTTWRQFQNLVFTETLEGAIDPIHNEYLLFCTGLPVGKHIAVYSIDSGNWISYLSHYVQSINVFRNQYLISFNNDAVNLHNSSGVYLPSEITLISNKNLISEKTYQNIAIDSHFDNPSLGTWESPLITVKTSDNQDQASILMQDDFRLIRGQYTSPFWRDFYSQGGIANGDRLRGTSMAINLKTDNTEKWEMFSVEVSFSDSQRDI